MRLAILALAAYVLMTVVESASAASDHGSQKMSQAVPADKLTQGKAVFAQWCAGCHGPLPGMGRFPPAGSYRLQQRYKDTVSATLEDRIDLTPDFIRTVVRQGMPIMPPLRRRSDGYDLMVIATSPEEAQMTLRRIASSSSCSCFRCRRFKIDGIGAESCHGLMLRA
jgi:cytochrome c5